MNQFTLSASFKSACFARNLSPSETNFMVKSVFPRLLRFKSKLIILASLHCGRSLVWSRTSACHSVNWSAYRDYLDKKYTKQYTSLLYSYAIKYESYLSDVAKISELKPSIKSNVLKALICLSKYLGTYIEFTTAFKNHGIKWVTTDSFNSFVSIFNSNHDTLVRWFKDVVSILADNERLFLKFTLVSGLRKSESVKAFNRIIELSQQNRLSEYFNAENSMLEHFRFSDNLRNTKNAFITVLDRDMLTQICNSKAISYSTIRKKLAKNNLPLRLKELRSYNNSYLRKHGILSEMVDILAGRIPKSVFVRHYLKESQSNLSGQVMPIQHEMLALVS